MASDVAMAITGPWMWEGLAVSWMPLLTLFSPFYRASSQTCPGPNPLHYLYFVALVSGPPKISYMLLLGLSLAGHRMWCGLPLPRLPLCPPLSPWSQELLAFAVRDYGPPYLENKELLLCVASSWSQRLPREATDSGPRTKAQVGGSPSMPMVWFAGTGEGPCSVEAS